MLCVYHLIPTKLLRYFIPTTCGCTIIKDPRYRPPKSRIPLSYRDPSKFKVPLISQTPPDGYEKCFFLQNLDPATQDGAVLAEPLSAPPSRHKAASLSCIIALRGFREMGPIGVPRV